MSKNIAIQEGGIGKQLTADKLKTNLVGGGTCLWVPEDETQLGTKYISENGTYRASADGYYGYSEVTVSGVGTTTGKDPDGSGDEATASVDPDTGDIVINKIPSSISVVTPPTNPYGIYQDGQTIGKDGMVVKAYLESGGEYGTVPNGEITLSPTTAVYDPDTDVPGGGTATSDLDTSLPQPIEFSSACRSSSQREGQQPQTYSMSADATFLTGKSSSSGYTAATVDALSKTREGISLTRNGQAVVIPPSAITNFTINGKTVYEATYRIGGPSDKTSFEGVDYTGKTVDQNSKWTMVWGDIEERPAGSRQQITVSWPRPGDGKVLETSFEILVAPGYTPGGGE